MYYEFDRIGKYWIIQQNTLFSDEHYKIDYYTYSMCYLLYLVLNLPLQHFYFTVSDFHTWLLAHVCEEVNEGRGFILFLLLKSWKHWQCISIAGLLNNLFHVHVIGGKSQLRHGDGREQFYGPHNTQYIADFS